MGSAVATYSDFELCTRLSYSGLSQEVENVSHIHGPGAIGVDGPVIFEMTNGLIKRDCFFLDEEQEELLFDNELYFNIHSNLCPPGEIRGQILQV